MFPRPTPPAPNSTYVAPTITIGEVPNPSTQLLLPPRVLDVKTQKLLPEHVIGTSILDTQKTLPIRSEYVPSLQPPVGTQLSLFKKGGKVKKIRKCEDGLPGYTQGLDLGIGFDNQGNVVNIDPVTGLPKKPTLAEIGRATQLREASKTATPTTATKGGNAIDLDQQASHIALRRNADGNIATRTGDVIENTSGN